MALPKNERDKMRAKSGRPKGDRVTRSMVFRADVRLLERLAALSGKSGISQSQLVCNFVDVGLDWAESPAGVAAFQLRQVFDKFKEQAYGADLLVSA